MAIEKLFEGIDFDDVVALETADGDPEPHRSIRTCDRLAVPDAGRDVVIVSIGVTGAIQPHLFEVARAGDGAPLLHHGLQRGQQQTRQDRNDRDHHEQSDQGEGFACRLRYGIPPIVFFHVCLLG